MRWFIVAIVLSLAPAGWSASTTQPAKKTPAVKKPAGAPAKAPANQDPEGTLKTLLTPRPDEPPLQPLPEFPKENAASATVAPTPSSSAGGMPPVTGVLLREDTFIYNRVGTVEKTPDGLQQQFIFDSDGAAMKDPPMILLPNQNLMLMETGIKKASGHLKFRVTGVVTEYGSRNYLLVKKFVVLGENNPLKYKRPEDTRP